jgi:predicted nucleotidyltransferase
MDTVLLENLRAAAIQLFRDGPLLAAYAYGSRVSGRQRPGSDLDVGYYLKGYRAGELLTLREESRLASALSEAMGIEVDLRDLAGASLEFRGRVLEEGARIYSADDVARVALERELLGRYHDYKDIYRRMHDERLRSLAARGI